MVNGITTDNKEFVLTRFPQARASRLEHRGHVWYGITLDGSDVSLFNPPVFACINEDGAWQKLAKVICDMEVIVGSFKGRAK